MKKLLVLASILSMVVLFSGCGYASPNTQSNSGQSTTSSGAVTIQNFAFSPATSTVKKGTTVTWTNQDSATHKIKSDTFNSTDLGKGQTFSFTFNNVGTFSYSCSIHPSMTGKIIVGN